MIQNVVSWLTDLMESMGYVGVTVAVFLETVFPPIPSAFIQPFAGFVASRTDQILLLTILSATVGSYLGTLPFYFLGVWGKDFVDRFLRKYGKYLFIEQSDVDKAFSFFDKYGKSVTFFGRLVPLVRTFVSFPAGVVKMSFVQFTIYTLLGAGLWSTILTVAGYLLGTQWELIIFWLEKYENLVIAVSIAAIIVYIIYKIIRRKKKN